MIRYHSFYPWHREGAYQHLMNEKDYDQLKAVKAFNRELTLLHILETSFNIDCLLSLWSLLQVWRPPQEGGAQALLPRTNL